MHIANFADNVVLLLARVQSKGLASIADGDYDRLGDAIRFLERAKQGYAWLDQPTVSSDSRSFVSSFTATVRSLGPRPSDQAFLSVLDLFLTTLTDLRGGKLPSEDKVKSVREFFARLAAAAMDGVDDVVLQPQLPGPSNWNLASGSFR
jgi:hypothetical protein